MQPEQPKLDEDLNKALGYGKSFIHREYDSQLWEEMYSAWLLGLVKGLKSFKENRGSTLLSWLITKASFEVKSQYKYIKREAEASNNCIGYKEQEKECHIDYLNAKIDLAKFLPHLNSQERFIMQGLLQELSLEEIGVKMNLTRGRVSQIKTKIFKILKKVYK